MKMLLVILTPLVAFTVLVTTVLAQTPVTPPEATTTPEPMPTQPTGSISGRIVVRDDAGGRLPAQILVMPATLPQPVPYGEWRLYLMSTDGEGNFSATGLVDGDYFIVIGPRDLSATASLRDRVTLEDPQRGDTFTLPALRVTVANGESVTGIEIVLVFPTPSLVIDDFGEAPAAGLPRTGVGGDTSGSVGAYLGAGVAAAAVLVLASGVAWRVRGGRWRR